MIASSSTFYFHKISYFLLIIPDLVLFINWHNTSLWEAESVKYDALIGKTREK